MCTIPFNRHFTDKQKQRHTVLITSVLRSVQYAYHDRWRTLFEKKIKIGFVRSRVQSCTINSHIFFLLIKNVLVYGDNSSLRHSNPIECIRTDSFFCARKITKAMRIKINFTIHTRSVLNDLSNVVDR